jgi:hypothetical protein
MSFNGNFESPFGYEVPNCKIRVKTLTGGKDSGVNSYVEVFAPNGKKVGDLNGRNVPYIPMEDCVINVYHVLGWDNPGWTPDQEVPPASQRLTDWYAEVTAPPAPPEPPAEPAEQPVAPPLPSNE